MRGQRGRCQEDTAFVLPQHIVSFTLAGGQAGQAGLRKISRLRRIRAVTVEP